ncbi:hypothetical protein PLESTF_000883600 [Pleodorina starrii]|nr:hypothetical protein PLESTM_000939900 [Pleodorina starrii]GLC69815.1 hypothetical protein PLESTF_000883600 [Pleodorina starrii]
MFRSKPTPAEQLATAVSQLSEGLFLVPNLVASEPQRGLSVVAEHVQRCGPAIIDTTRVMARHREQALLVAEELEEAAEALREHAQAAAPELTRMLARLQQAAAAVSADDSSHSSGGTTRGGARGSGRGTGSGHSAGGGGGGGGGRSPGAGATSRRDAGS